MIYYFSPVHHKFFQFQLLKILYIRILNQGLKYEDKTVECIHKDSKFAKRIVVVILDNKQHLDVWDQQQW